MIEDFISFLHTQGLTPFDASEIRADGKFRSYRLTDDPQSKKRGRYKLSIEGETGDGVAWSWRQGIYRQWRPRRTKPLTDAERREIAQWLAGQRALNQREREEQAAAAQQDAITLWGKGKKAKHPYITLKGVSGKGTLVYGQDLLIPMAQDGALWGVQKITPDGAKYFQSGVKKKGSYCAIKAEPDAPQTIYIAEGYATACSVHDATGCLTVCAFDAGNLLPVAKSWRERNPDARIVIAGDNDASKVGQNKASNAADAVGGAAIWPDVEGMDWNDVAQENGLDYIRNALASVGAPQVGICPHTPDADLSPPSWLDDIPPIDDTDPRGDWQSDLRRTAKGKILSKSLVNCQIILGHAHPFCGLFSYNQFSHEKMVISCPPWEPSAKWKPRAVTDEDATWIAIALERAFGVDIGLATLRKVLDAVIRRTSINPARQYFEQLIWDGMPRLDKWLAYYVGAEFDDAEYVSMVGAKWLCAVVARVFVPGIKFDHILILEGKQGARKSSLLRELATIGGEEYFDDTIKVTDLGEDRTVPKLQGVLIVELAELSGLRKADMEKFKQQITIQEDRLVRKYANEASRYPRQFVFAGTINPVDGYLDDPTGSRRMWPVKVGKIDLAALKRDKDQLWAEAVVRWRAGETLYLPDEMQARTESVKDSRQRVHPWQQTLEDVFTGRTWVSSVDIWDALKIPTEHRDPVKDAHAGKIMRAMGFEKQRRRINGKRVYGYGLIENDSQQEEIDFD